jgi:predicted kinase
VLWELGVPPAEREHVAHLVRHHQVPFWVLARDDAEPVTLRVSVTARCDHLTLLARADATGRDCADQADLLDRVELFAEWAAGLGCLDRAYPFASDHARVAYFRTPGRDPAWAAYDDTRTRAIVLSGLPAAGKDHWLAAEGPDWPVVGLDTIRAGLGVQPGNPQHAVVDAAYSAAREHLRRRQPFVWNATNLSRSLRGRVLTLMADYGARVRIVTAEAGPADLHARNRARPRPVPQAAIDRMLRIWEPPDPTEAHTVERVPASPG